MTLAGRMLLCGATALASSAAVLAQGGGLPPATPPESGVQPPYDQVGIDQRLGERVPLDLVFRDESGRVVTLSEYFDDRPVILSLAYYRCPMLCSMVQNGIVSSLGVIALEPGDDFRVVTVSIDPDETPEMAAASKTAYLERYGRPGAKEGWHFLTGDAASIQDLARAVGFRYARDEETGQYAHASGIMVVTPDGRLAQYFLGIEYAPRDLRLALVEASGGRIGTLVDSLILLCYQYDPATGRYGAMTIRMVRIGGILTVLMIGLFVFVMLRRDARADARGTA